MDNFKYVGSLEDGFNKQKIIQDMLNIFYILYEKIRLF